MAKKLEDFGLDQECMQKLGEFVLSRCQLFNAKVKFGCDPTTEVMSELLIVEAKLDTLAKMMVEDPNFTPKNYAKHFKEVCVIGKNNANKMKHKLQNAPKQDGH